MERVAGGEKFENHCNMRRAGNKVVMSMRLLGLCLISLSR